MKDSVRRIVMLCTILTFGLILIFWNVTIVTLFVMMFVLVIVLSFLLGIVTVTEIRTALATIKFSRKPATSRDQKGKPTTEKAQQKSAKPGPGKTADTKAGFGTHLKSIFSSVDSLGTILKARGRSEKKVEDINKMLDKTISEKVTKPAASAGAGAPLPASGGAGSLDDSDPFLSGDEFDAGLLDGLDDDTAFSSSAGTGPAPEGEPAADLPAPELLMPSFDNTDETSAAPADDGGGLDAFSGLDSGSEMDAEFGDLDNLSLDDVELDEDMDGMSVPATSPDEVPPGEAPAASAAAPKTESTAVKTAWIASDAPPDADMTEDQIGIQSDMASFAGGSGGTDEDLLSSIASDVKTHKKEADISLLRELKDFKAPAMDIEDELKGMYQKIGGISKEKEKEKDQQSTDGIK
ncbi:MAG: hypothetical protein M0R30_13910 [Methanoregula sp.]|uniref:hypothetical protein n=1 Tax=Methanoregula sp. TaxID=2052170 RepID=UPI0025F5054A|nr:hypothetical protein [Methanoregula sp.]MCK9632722.1 hypothetical protein [Methanoregula sp.]